MNDSNHISSVIVRQKITVIVDSVATHLVLTIVHIAHTVLTVLTVSIVNLINSYKEATQSVAANKGICLINLAILSQIMEIINDKNCNRISG